MSLYDKTSPMAARYSDRHRHALGAPVDSRPRCEYCVQLIDWCLCAPAPARKGADVHQA